MNSRIKSPPRAAAITVAGYIGFLLDTSGKTRNQIAEEAGIERPNVISMMRMGTMKVPLSVAPKLAVALGIDPAQFVRRCLAEYIPELVEFMDAAVGVSRNEVELLRVIRKATKDTDPALSTKEQERQLAQAVKAVLMR